jgi:hypothetical protein
LLIDDLEAAIAVPGSTLGTDATEGSAIRTVLNQVKAGDRFSFNWSFQTFDTLFFDRAFVTINDSVFNLNTGNLFSYTFTNAGNYSVAIGVVDVTDVLASSIDKSILQSFLPSMS